MPKPVTHDPELARELVQLVATTAKTLTSKALSKDEVAQLKAGGELALKLLPLVAEEEPKPVTMRDADSAPPVASLFGTAE